MPERNYPRNYQHLNILQQKLAKLLPEAMGSFDQLQQVLKADGALSARMKELLALGIAIHARSADAIAAQVNGSLRAGATRQELIEVIGIAVLMGGELAMISGCAALEALEQFEIEIAEELAVRQLDERMDD